MCTKLTTTWKRGYLLIIATWLLHVQAVEADQPRLRVVYADVFGTERLESGELQAGIDFLRGRLKREQPEDAGGILATLCAAYIVEYDLENARQVCDEAVSREPTETAINNRGVFRAVTGDLDGARADFRRVRPVSEADYLREMRKKDVPLVATDNLALVERAIDTRRNGRRSDVTEARIVPLDTHSE